MIVILYRYVPGVLKPRSTSSPVLDCGCGAGLDGDECRHWMAFSVVGEFVP